MNKKPSSNRVIRINVKVREETQVRLTTPEMIILVRNPGFNTLADAEKYKLQFFIDSNLKGSVNTKI
jgi:hypothetical protein